MACNVCQAVHRGCLRIGVYAASSSDHSVYVPRVAKRLHPGQAVQHDTINPTLKAPGTINPTLKAPGTNLLTLECDEPLSTVAFKFNLRRYTLGQIMDSPQWVNPPEGKQAGLTLVHFSAQRKHFCGIRWVPFSG